MVKVTAKFTNFHRLSSCFFRIYILRGEKLLCTIFPHSKMFTIPICAYYTHILLRELFLLLQHDLYNVFEQIYNTAY